MRFESLKVPQKLLGHARLLRALYRDPRAPRKFKIGAWLLFLYLVMPFDLIPDFIPVLGQLDDLLIFAAGCKLLLRLCPAEMVEEHRVRIEDL